MSMFADKCLQSTATTGTGTFSLNSTGVGAFKSWRSQFADGSTVFYVAENADGTIWEVGYGTLTYGTPDTLTRNLLSSSTGALISWTLVSGLSAYVFSAPVGLANPGRFDASKTMWIPDLRRPLTAVGAADKTVTVADIAGRFTLDTSAAQRSVTLPAGSSVGEGFSIEVRATSDVFPLAIVPNGTDAIDAGAGGATKYVCRTSWFNLFWNGAAWETTIGERVMIKKGTLSAAANFDIKNIPSNVNLLDVRLEFLASNNNVTLDCQTYGADGVLDTGGSDYSAWETITSSGGTVTGSGATAASFSPFGAIGNASSVGAMTHFRATNIQAASKTKFDFISSYLDQAGVLGYVFSGAAWRNEADRITGLKGTISAGTITGRWWAIGQE